MRRAVVVTAALVIAAAGPACDRRGSIASCDDDLRGVYTTGPGRGEPAEHAERWMVLDSGARLEAYPLFPDAEGPADLVVAPRRIDLERPGGAAPRRALTGTLSRRYMRRAERCDARVLIHVVRCADDTLELVLADPAPPIELSPCTWPGPGPSRIERWRRE